MYVPTIHKPRNPFAVAEYIRQNAFATLTGVVDGIQSACHIPLVLSEDATTLAGHVAKSNTLSSCFNGSSEMLAIFMGTHAYISSSWYDHVNVPTWNYVAVHVYGRAVRLKNHELTVSLKKLVDMYEVNRNNRFAISDMGDNMLNAHLAGLIGFQFNIDRIEAAFKLSQNRNYTDYAEIIRQLEMTEDPLSQRLANEMKVERNL